MNPPPTSLPITSLWVITRHQPQHAVSCIRHRLGIRFLHDSIHVTMPFSQIIPPSASPSESKSPLYISVSFLLSCIQGRHCHLPKFTYICVSILYWCFSFWLTSLCIIGSSFIHLIRTDSNVFFFFFLNYSLFITSLGRLSPISSTRSISQHPMFFNFSIYHNCKCTAVAIIDKRSVFFSRLQVP